MGTSIGESKYAYLLTDHGLFRVNIPNFDQAHQPPQFKLECVGMELPATPSSTMGIFSQGQNVYLVGGIKGGLFYNGRMHIFNPSKTKKYPIKKTMALQKSSVKYEPMVDPRVIHTKNQIYFFSENSLPIGSPFCFQSFNPSIDDFCTLSTPSLDNYGYYDLGHLVVYDYIYLFIKEQIRLGIPDQLRAFSFNTRSSKWKEIPTLCSKFEQEKIPIPYGHCGDIGLSDRFSDRSQILVALVSGAPTAYHVWVGAAGKFLRPKSYRHLVKHDYGGHNMSHLLDIGCQRFCVIFYCEAIPLWVYAFKMNFEVEYENQGKSTSDAMPSIEILSSKKFYRTLYPSSPAFSVCLASAPASQSCFPCEEEVDDDGDGSNHSDKREPGVVYLDDY